MHEMYSPWINLWYGLNSKTATEGGLALKVVDWLGDDFGPDEFDMIRLMDSWYSVYLKESRE